MTTCSTTSQANSFNDSSHDQEKVEHLKQAQGAKLQTQCCIARVSKRFSIVGSRLAEFMIVSLAHHACWWVG